MKELSIEEKAKAYDEALEKAKNYHSPETACNVKIAMENLFPELKESEDERIRKDIISHFAKGIEGSSFDEVIEKYKIWIAWLEKQVPVHLSHDDEIMIRQLTEYFTTGKGLQNTNDTVVEWLTDIKRKLEKQGKQKSIDNLTQQDAMDIAVAKCFEQGKQKLTDNVEPKFKEGDWIISDTVDKDYHICKIISIKDGNYTIESIYGYKGYNQFDVFDTAYKLWTIQDAKDGDVLACESGWTCIFKALDNRTNTFSSYCFMDSDKWFCNTGSECHTLDKAFIKAYNGEIYPATKEQRDLLFQRIHEAGYMWDSESKQLLSLKAEPIDEQKSVWSEEDDKILKSIIINIENLQFSEDMREKYHHIPNANKSYYQIKIDWLKSLKDRYTWKPSDEQMKFLWKYAEQNNCDGSILTSLYNDLKKLKG